jgi:hypothetical protein
LGKTRVQNGYQTGTRLTNENAKFQRSLAFTFTFHYSSLLPTTSTINRSFYSLACSHAQHFIFAISQQTGTVCSLECAALTSRTDRTVVSSCPRINRRSQAFTHILGSARVQKIHQLPSSCKDVNNHESKMRCPSNSLHRNKIKTHSFDFLLHRRLLHTVALPKLLPFATKTPYFYSVICTKRPSKCTFHL